MCVRAHCCNLPHWSMYSPFLVLAGSCVVHPTRVGALLAASPAPIWVPLSAQESGPETRPSTNQAVPHGCGCPQRSPHRRTFMPHHPPTHTPPCTDPPPPLSLWSRHARMRRDHTSPGHHASVSGSPAPRARGPCVCRTPVTRRTEEGRRQLRRPPDPRRARACPPAATRRRHQVEVQTVALFCARIVMLLLSCVKAWAALRAGDDPAGLERSAAVPCVRCALAPAGPVCKEHPPTGEPPHRRRTLTGRP